MPRKRKGGGGSIALYALLLVIALLAQIPKQVWITIGIMVGIAVLVWVVKRASQGKPYVAEEEDVTPEITPSPRSAPPAVTISLQLNANQWKPELHTVQVGSSSNQNFSIPKPSAKPVGVHWIGQNETVTVAGLSLPCGMVYVCERSTQFGHIEPSLIDATLRIARSPVSLTDRQMPYWPSYKTITPEARRAYLQWLAGGRCEDADVGYIFLFFYGLERRAFIDAPNDAQAKAELPAIAAEVTRLLGVYGANSSFRGYATRFLAHLSSSSVQPKSYLQEPPSLSPDGYELPMPLRIALGQMAMDKHPLNPSWALVWALSDPNISRRTPVTRCPEEFAELFKSQYAKRYPNGITLGQNKTKLKIAYRPASSALTIPAVSIGDLPDVAATSGTRNKLQVIVEECTVVLDSYSRYLGRNPDASGTLEGILQLPTSLWPLEAKTELELLEQRVGGETICMSFGELAGRFKSAGALSRDKVLALARALESKRIGLEPDVLSGSRIPKAENTIALFAADTEDGTLRATDAYSAAAVTLDLASAVAAADGDTSLEEVNLLSGHIDSWDHLCVAHRKRLKAHLQIQLKQPPTLASLKKKLEPLTQDAKRKIAGFLAHLAQADGEVTPQEVKLLERVYKSLALDPQFVYSDLHSAAIRPSQTVATTITAANNTTVDEHPQKAGAGFVLDMEKVARLQQETAEVSALLANVFSDEPAPELGTSQQSEVIQEPEETAIEQHVTVHGLDVEHSAFLRLLISRTEWSRAELEDAATDMELMLDGALEQINDTAFELFNMPVTEGDDPIEINPDILDELDL
ncbi:TerB N-terminal domain-containing protein [Pseudomonas sp. 22526]|uniref:tellurite resistance TerB family protein n=1 Tax=Pseudomonas sp. 22526 TaxID=3453937 RepID=UPI003F82C77F